MYDPIPDPVPPAIEWHNRNPYKQEIHTTCNLMHSLVSESSKALGNLWNVVLNYLHKLNECVRSIPQQLIQWLTHRMDLIRINFIKYYCQVYVKFIVKFTIVKSMTHRDRKKITSKLSLPSASLSIISNTSSYNLSPCNTHTEYIKSILSLTTSLPSKTKCDDYKTLFTI